MKGRRPRRMQLHTVLAVALAVAFAAAVAAVVHTLVHPGPPSQPQQLVKLPVPPWAISVGRPDAPVTLVELFDVHCPYCALAHVQLDGLYKRLVAEGRLRLVLVDYITHPPLSYYSHALLHCAHRLLGENATYRLVTALYEVLVRERNFSRQIELLESAVRKLNATCAGAPTPGELENLTRAWDEALERLGVRERGTPTFVVLRGGAAAVPGPCSPAGRYAYSCGGTAEIVVGADVERLRELLTR